MAFSHIDVFMCVSASANVSVFAKIELSRDTTICTLKTSKISVVAARSVYPICLHTFNSNSVNLNVYIQGIIIIILK